MTLRMEHERHLAAGVLLEIFMHITFYVYVWPWHSGIYQKHRIIEVEIACLSYDCDRFCCSSAFNFLLN